MTRLALDLAYPSTLNAADTRAQLCDVLAFYIGGATPHVWTPAELLETLALLPNVQYLLPIYTYGPGMGDAGDEHAATANRLAGAFGCPEGVALAVDVEQGFAAGATPFLDRWAPALLPRIPVAYTSASSRGHIPPAFRLWLAAWNNAAHFEPGSVATQFASPTIDPSLTFDLSLVDDELPLWRCRPSVVPTPPAPPPSSSTAPRLNGAIVELVPTGDDGGYWLIGSDGGIFAFGNAPSLVAKDHTGRPITGEHLAGAIVGAKRTHDGRGLWLAGADGEVYAAGDAPLHGSLVAHFSPAPDTPADPT